MARLSEADLPLFKEKRVNDPEKALKLLRVEARGCTRCDLYKNATQTVFGEGPADASLMLIGEQPGDQEDLAGLPFVGPAGKVLDKALEAASIERSEVYITNAVKHFKNEPRGKRRIHKKPDTSEIDACRWWLDNELDLVQPAVAVAMGATAHHYLGVDWQLRAVLAWFGARVVATSVYLESAHFRDGALTDEPSARHWLSTYR